MQIAYILTAYAGTFVKTPCLRGSVLFLGMHARASIWYSFNYFLHFMLFRKYENTVGNTNSVVIRVYYMTLTSTWASAYKSTPEAAPILVRQSRARRQRLQTACITSSWLNDTA